MPAARVRATRLLAGLATLLVLLGSSAAPSPAPVAPGGELDPAAAVADAVRPATAVGAPADRRETVFEGRLFLWHGDALPDPIAEGVTLETAAGQLPVEMTTADALAIAGSTVRLRGTLQAGVIVPTPGVAPEVIVAAGTDASSTTTTAVTAAATTRKLAVILFNFPDNTAQTWTPAAVEDLVLDADGSRSTSVRAYYEEASDGAFTLSGAVLGWYRIAATSGSCSYSTWASQARTAAASDATAAGLDLASTSTLKVYLFPRVAACSWAGLGELPGDDAWSNGYLHIGVIGHELGHNLGVHHASTLACKASTNTGTPVTSRTADDCVGSEYGDPYSLMGDAWGHQYTHNAWHRSQLGYPVGTQTVTVTAGLDVTYDLLATEPDTDGTALRLIRIARGATGTYLDLELRRGSGPFDTFSSTSSVVTGVSARIGAANTVRTQSKLLDNTPTASFSDAAIQPGSSMWDPVAGARVSVLSVTDGIATVRIQAEADTAAPAAPGSLAATVSGTPQVTLSWAPASDDHVLAGYEIRRNGTRLAVVKALSWTDCAAGATCSLVGGQTYSYDVYAYDAAGKLSPAATISATIPQSDFTAPSAPGTPTTTDLTATSASLGWTAATDNAGGSGVASYQVLRDISGATTLLGTTSSTNFTVSGLGAESGYSFVVRAVDAAGNVGPASGVLSITTEPAPVAPATVTASLIGSTVTVTYDAPDKYASYDVRRETFDKRRNAWTSATIVASPGPCLASPGTCSVATALSKAGTYRYSVRSKNGALLSAYVIADSTTSYLR